MTETSEGYPPVSRLDAPPAVHRTPGGTLYLQSPGVVVPARPTFDPSAIRSFLEGFGPDSGLTDVLDDPVSLTPATGLCKMAGQLCYMSFGPRRTGNGDAARYFEHIMQSGHGSVLEHACFSILLYGISRSVTHELVRHRAGFAFSQVSQRYVSGSVLRFVERPEFQRADDLHRAFEERIDAVAQAYARLQRDLVGRQLGGDERLSGETGTARRKRVQQAARALLTNETEAPIIVTGNVRAWRHFIEARASEHADIEIRVLAHSIFRRLVQEEPILFADYTERRLPDGTAALVTNTPKV